MTNVVQLRQEINVPVALRNVADAIEKGDFGDVDEVTLVFPMGSNVLQLGVDDKEDDTVGERVMNSLHCALTIVTHAVLYGDYE